MTATATPVLPHPRIDERRAAVEDQKLRSRNRRLAAFGVLVLAALLAVAATQSALLDVDEVRVIGAVRESPDTIREFAQVSPGEPLLGLDLGAVENRLGALPDVAQVSVQKNWNGVVTIELVERVPTAQFVADGGAIITAADGIVLMVAEDVDIELPRISGAMFTAPPGATVPVVVSDALLVASTLPDDIADLTERVEISVDMLSLRLVGGGRIDLGDARDLETKFDAIRAFFAQVRLGCLDALNVQAPTVPVLTRKPSCS